MAKMTARWIGQSTVWQQEQTPDADGLPAAAVIDLEEVHPGLEELLRQEGGGGSPRRDSKGGGSGSAA